MELRRRLRVSVLFALATAAQLIAAVFGVSVIFAPTSATAVASVPYLINFQGRLTDNSGNVLSDGSYNVKFRIFDAATSGTNRWEGDRVYGASDNRITVTNGLFNIQFGDTSKGDPALSPALFNTQTYANLYLEVELPTPASATCASNGCAVFTEGAMTPRQPLASSPYAFNSDALDGLDSSDFAQIAANNTFTGANLFAPGASAVVGLTVKASTGGSTNSLEVFDSGGTRQAFFDASGALTLGKAITAPTSTNTINSLVINAGALSNVTGYAQASGTFLQSGSGTFGTGTGAVSLNGDTTVAAGKNLILPSGTGTFQQTFASPTAAASGQVLAFTNSNTVAAGVTMQGINITPAVNAPTSGTNTLNIVNFAAGNALTAAENANGLNFASAVGYTNFIKTPTFVLSSAGALTGVLSIAVATITNVGALTLTTTTATGVNANTVTTGTALTDTGLTTSAVGVGSIILGGANTTTGVGYLFNTTANAATTQKAINITGAAAAVTADVSGALISVNPTRTLTAAAARTDSLNYLNLTRAITTNNAAGSYAISGALASLQSNCTQTLGTCTDTSNILNLNQQYATASGAILNVQGAGTGNLATLDASNASANGASIDVQSSGSGQYVLKLTSNNAATNVLFARADGRVGIGNAAPSTALDVTGTVNGTGFSASGTAGVGSTVSCGANQAVTAAIFTSGLLTTAPTCSTISGTGAATDLSNLTTTNINQTLLPNTDNSLNIGSASKVWANVFTGNVDAGTTTTALTIGTAATTTAVTIGRSGLAVSLPGGLSTSGSNITTSNGTINTGSGTITSTGNISGGSLTIPSGSGTFSQTYTNNAAASAHSISVANTNTGAGVAIQGINLTPTNTSTASSGTNLVNLINFAAGGALGGTDQTNGINFASTTGYTNLLNSPNLTINASGDQTTIFTALNGTSTTNGAGTASTSLILTSATNFDVGNYVQVNDTNCGGSGVNPCYAKITAKVSNTLTITPALTWTTGKTVNEYHLPELGGVDTSQALANRYGRGYFIAGVATGNGTTYYDEGDITSSLTSFDLLNTSVTTLNVGGAATTINLGNSAGTVNIPGNLSTTGGGTFTSAGAISAPTSTNTINGIVINGGTISSAIWQGTAVDAGYGGTGQSSYVTGDLLYASSTSALSRLAAVASGSCLISQGTGVAPIWGACASGSATTTLNNLGTTAINASLIPNVTNSIDLGTPSSIWGNLYVHNIDAQSSTNTTLTIGTAATTTGITIGRSGVAVSLPGGLSTSGSNITTSNGTINTGSGSITTTGAIGAGAITGTSLATSSNGTINSGSGTISTTGALNGGTQTLGSNGALSTPVLNFTGTPFGGATAGASSLIQIGGAISGGNVATNGGTYLGLNLPASSAGSAADFLNFQKANTVEFKVDNSGNGTLGGGLTVGTGSVAAFSTAGLLQNVAIDSTVTYSNLQKVGTINTGTWQGTAVGVLYGGTGQTTYTDGQLLIGNTTGNTLTKATLTGTANRLSITNGSGSITLNVDATQFPSSAGANTILKSSGANAASWVANTQTNVCSDCAVTTLSNVGSTSIGAALVASGNNTQNIGSLANVWQNVFTGNLDAGTTTTALTVGTASTTTAITIGRAAVAVSIPGGITTSNGTINTGSGSITTTGALSAGGITGTSLGLGSGNITTTGTIGAAAITGTSLATSGNGTINSGSGTISTTGALNGGTLVATTSVTSPSFTGTGAVSLTSAAATALTLDSLSGNLIMGTNTTAIQKAAAAFAIDLATAGTSTLTVKNSNGANVANLTVTGSIGGGAITGTSLSAGSGTISTTGVISGIGSGLTSLNPTNLVQGSGAVTLQSAAATSTNITSNAAATWQTTTGLLSITGAAGVTVSAGGSAQNISLTPSTTGTVIVGGTTPTLTSAGALTLLAGSTAQNINITPTTSGQVVIGGTTPTVTSSGAITLQAGGTAQNVLLTPSTTGTVLVAGTTPTVNSASSLTLGAGGTAQNVNINPTTTGQVVIGGTTPTVTSGTSITLQAGGTAQNVNITPSTSGTVVVGGATPTVTTSGATALKVDTGGAAALNLGSTNANAVNIGNATAATQVLINGGTNATNAIGLTAATNGTILAATTGTGNIEFNTASSVLVQTTTDSKQAFQVQNAATSSIFNIDTTDTNPIQKSGFEVATLTPWANLTGGTLAEDLTQHYVGFASGKVTAGTSAGGGISQPITLTNGTQYTLSFYAKLDSASAALTTLQAGYSNTGLAGGEVDCALNSSTLLTAGWQRYVCTFVAGAASGTPYIYIEHNDTTSEVFYVDAVQLDTGSFATPYGSGQISLNANINSPVNFQEAANSTSAFQITNTSGTNILNVDTLNNNLNNQASNPSFEAGVTGWAAKTGCTLTQDSTGGYNGSSSGKCVNTATANAGMNMTGIVPVMVSGTTYTLSLYVKSSLNMSTLELGRSDTGLVANDTACLTGQTVTALGWKRLTCTFIPGAQSGTPYIYIRQTDATARTIWVDAVLLETDANASSNYRDGRISLGNATISSPAVFQTNTNSTTAFQIQNAAGIQVFNVDTASDTDLVANSGFEVNSVGWSTMNGATNLVRDTSKTYIGIASGKVTTTTTASSGMRYTFPAALPAVAATSYTISAYVETSVADATFAFGYNNGADTACVVSPAASATVPSVNGWTRFTCSTPVNTLVNSIYITSGTTAVTLNVDGVRVELGSVATAFGNSNISFNGVFTSAVAIRNPNDTTTEFQVQTGASLNLFTVDSLNKNIIVGGGFSTTDTTVITLNLDSSSTFAETAGTCSNTAGGGSIYYNSSINTIRACIRDSINSAGNWEDLPSTAGLGAILFGVVPDSGLSADQGDWTDIGGATKGPCKVSWASATTVSVAPCNAYSGGRKVTVASATVVTMPAVTAGQFVHVCFSSTTGAPVASAAGTEVANMPTFSANNPVLCLADVLAGGVNTTSKIYDLRTFTTTQKEFVVNQTTAAGLGQVVSVATSTPVNNGVTQMPTTTNTANLRGVVVATTGVTSTTAINAIIAVRGPQWIKFAAAAGVLNNIVQPVTGGVAGYPSSVAGTASTGIWGNLGLQLRVSDNATCSSSANCQMSVPVDLTIR